MSLSVTVLLALAVGAIGVLMLLAQRMLRAEGKGKEEPQEQEQEQESKESSKPSNAPLSKRQLAKAAAAASGDSLFKHPWLLTSLKGHSGRVMDVQLSENGKYVASCAEDRTVLVWTTKDFASKEHKSARGNVAYDTATHVRWSPDNKAYVVAKEKETTLEVYKVSRKENGSLGNITAAVTFTPPPHASECGIIDIGFASNGKYLMSCSEKTTLILWDLKGEVLQTLDTYHMSTYCAKVSPCGRFVASSGFTPDVKVWEVRFKRTGDFDGAHRAFELTGHPSGVLSFDFNGDSSKMVTLCKDGNWRLFETRIEFARGQDATLLLKASATSGISPETSFGDSPNARIALSPDATVVVVAQGTTLSWFDASTGTRLAVVEKVHATNITSLCFDKEGKMLLSSGDKHIRVFNNVPGFKLQKKELKKKLAEAPNEGTKERLKQLISQLETRITEE